jgi:transcriptional regulator with XRE-family HTH domain
MQDYRRKRTLRELKERIQYLIDLKKISQRDLADKLATDEARVSEWLSGKVTKPRRTTLFKIADYFQCDLEWLATGDGEPFPLPATKTAENYGSFSNRKKQQETDQTLERLMLEKFKLQCGNVYFDEFFEFIADNYGPDKEGIDQFFTELINTHANYRIWLIEKKEGRENVQAGGRGNIAVNGK